MQTPIIQGAGRNPFDSLQDLAQLYLRYKQQQEASKQQQEAMGDQRFESALGAYEPEQQIQMRNDRYKMNLPPRQPSANEQELESLISQQGAPPQPPPVRSMDDAFMHSQAGGGVATPPIRQQPQFGGGNPYGQAFGVYLRLLKIFGPDGVKDGVVEMIQRGQLPPELGQQALEIDAKVRTSPSEELTAGVQMRGQDVTARGQDISAGTARMQDTTTRFTHTQPSGTAQLNADVERTKNAGGGAEQQAEAKKKLGQIGAAKVMLGQIVDAFERFENPKNMQEKVRAGADFWRLRNASGVMIGKVLGETGNFAKQEQEAYKWFVSPNLTMTVIDPVLTQRSLAKAQEFLDNAETSLSGGSSSTPSPSGSLKVGDRKTFPNGKVGQWDGNGWVQVR